MFLPFCKTILWTTIESIGLDISFTELRRGNKLLVLARIGIQWILSWHKIGCLVHIWTPKCIGGPFGWKAWDPIFFPDNQQPAFNTFQTRHFRKKIQTLRNREFQEYHHHISGCILQTWKLSKNLHRRIFGLKILHHQFHLISTVLVRKNTKNEWKWRNLHRWQKFYTAAGTDGMDKFHLCREHC